MLNAWVPMLNTLTSDMSTILTLRHAEEEKDDGKDKAREASKLYARQFYRVYFKHLKVARCLLALGMSILFLILETTLFSVYSQKHLDLFFSNPIESLGFPPLFSKAGLACLVSTCWKLGAEVAVIHRCPSSHNSHRIVFVGELLLLL